jgi:heat shock protein HtpX
MTPYGLVGRHDARSRHRWLNRLQTALLVLTLVGIAAAAGSLLFGEIAPLAGAGRCIAPCCSNRRRLRDDLASVWRPSLHPHEAPEIWALLLRAARVAPVCPQRRFRTTCPAPSSTPSPPDRSSLASIALTDGLLRSLSMRELQAVLAHEVAHIAQEDLRVMGLADSDQPAHEPAGPCWVRSRSCSACQRLLVGAAEIYWPGLLLLAASPQLALLAQLGLSRVREFDADRIAAELTGDPHGLASALAKIERVSRSWRAWLLPGWGNPEPSWLRTHPATRIVSRACWRWRLSHRSPAVPNGPISRRQGPFAPMRPPRWHPSGLWR